MLARQPQNELLDAIATILVRDVEVVAIAASGPNIVAIQDAIQQLPGSDADDNQNYSNVKIAGIGNPRKEDTYEFPDGRNFMMVKEGRSHLARSPAETDAWKHYLKIPKDDPLSNHIHTVVDFLKKHKRVRSDARWAHQTYFAKYLVVRCWPKMERRISSWSSRGYVYVLGQVRDRCITGWVSSSSHKIPGMFTSQHNRGLTGLVVEMVRDGTMGSVIMGPSGYSERSLAHLVASYSNIVTPRQVVPSQDDNGGYDITTCTEFHQLLVATLLTYGKVLCALPDARRMAETGKNTMDDFAEKLDKVWRCGRLLWVIASLRMFRHHLVACQGDLSLPTHDNSDSYHRFTNFKPAKGPAVDTPADPNTPADTDDLDFVEDAKVHLVTGEAMHVMFLEWFQVQASHSLALATLSKAFGFHDLHKTVPDVYLIAVQHPELEGNSREVESWETTLTNLLKEYEGTRHELNVEDVLGVMRTAVHKEHIYIGAIHCEIALATLAVLFQKLPVADTKRHPILADVLQNMDQTIIAVSKRCCPVCWELLDILRDKCKQFHVCGRHSTLFPVELPSWLSEDYMGRNDLSL
ncbi:hypothetical protein PILCRDRAFT_489866 [Piloderma croceum F 1598]|uniref:Uncharacterized protein n=1 Tax=Piloderma croceum (strain F 1598) TaxID=765440 RepID=A0A0C3FAV0_PILCF|nr:hypothetical protein PILCRDRAFT_489866 [Piloderma croceum F 1598]